MVEFPSIKPGRYARREFGGGTTAPGYRPQQTPHHHASLFNIMLSAVHPSSGSCHRHFFPFPLALLGHFGAPRNIAVMLTG